MATQHSEREPLSEERDDWITTHHRLDDLEAADTKIPLSCEGFVCLVWTQIVVVSVIATLSRGTLNALNAVGGLGTADVQTATMVNLLSSLSFSCLSWTSGGVVNVIGPRIACAIGSTTTTFTLTSLMLYTMLNVAPQWLVFVAATFDGIGSGILWTASGSITIKYPSNERKGFASTVLFAIYSCGAAAGGLMAFITNVRVKPPPFSDPGNAVPPSVEDILPLVPVQNTGLEPTSYSFMIGLAVVALCLSSLIRPESRVRNKDGTSVMQRFDAREGSYSVERNWSRHSRVSAGSVPGQSKSSFRLFSEMPSAGRGEILGSSVSKASVGSKRDVSAGLGRVLGREFRQLVATLQEQPVQMLLLFSFASLFHQTYLFNGINYRAFNVRTRGLNCFMYWIGRIPAGVFHGHVVDDVRYSTRRRAIHGFTLLLSHVVICQSLAVIFWMLVPLGHFDVATDPAATAMAFLAFFLYGGLDTVSQSFSLWLFSVLGRKYPNRIPHYVAISRCFQGFGVALAWFLDLNDFSTSQTQFFVCFVCWILAFPGLIAVICKLNNDDASPPVLLKDHSKFMGSWEDARCAVCDNVIQGSSLDISTQPSEAAGYPKQRDAQTMEIIQVVAVDSEIPSADGVGSKSLCSHECTDHNFD